FNRRTHTATGAARGDREVVGFRTTAGKHDLARFAAELGRDRFARVFDRGARRARDRVRPGRVAEVVREEGQHGAHGLGPHRRGSRVIEIHRRRGAVHRAHALRVNTFTVWSGNALRASETSRAFAPARTG